MRFLIILLVFISSQAVGQTDELVRLIDSTYDDITPIIQIDEAIELVYTDDVFFLDTREVPEFDVSHIEKAINVGYDDFKIKSVSHLKKDAEIIVYCSVGLRSQNIARILIKKGYTNVKNLYGGLFNWANHGYPMVDDSSKDTAMIHGYSKEWSKLVTTGIVVY